MMRLVFWGLVSTSFLAWRCPDSIPVNTLANKF